MSKLTGKVAIVTGASKGIGAGIAKGLGAAGAAVVVNYASSKTDAERVVAEITRKGGRRSRCRAMCPRRRMCSGCSRKRSRPSAPWTCS